MFVCVHGLVCDGRIFDGHCEGIMAKVVVWHVVLFHSHMYTVHTNTFTQTRRGYVYDFVSGHNRKYSVVVYTQVPNNLFHIDFSHSH